MVEERVKVFYREWWNNAPCVTEHLVLKSDINKNFEYIKRMFKNHTTREICKVRYRIPAGEFVVVSQERWR